MTVPCSSNALFGLFAVRTVRTKRAVWSVRCSNRSDRMRCSVLFAVRMVQAVRLVRCSGCSSNFEIFAVRTDRSEQPEQSNSEHLLFGRPWFLYRLPLCDKLGFLICAFGFFSLVCFGIRGLSGRAGTELVLDSISI